MTCMHCSTDFVPLLRVGEKKVRKRRYCSTLCRRRAYAKHAEEWRKADRKKDPTKYAARVRQTSLKRCYGITVEQYDDLSLRQRGVCAICKQPETKPHRSRNLVSYYLSVDHDHVSGELRGLLCNKCNRAIGLFNDDVELMKTALAYLEGFKAMHHGK